MLFVELWKQIAPSATVTLLDNVSYETIYRGKQSDIPEAFFERMIFLVTIDILNNCLCVVLEEV